jgi:hypothetical protein
VAVVDSVVAVVVAVVSRARRSLSKVGRTFGTNTEGSVQSRFVGSWACGLSALRTCTPLWSRGLERALL